MCTKQKPANDTRWLALVMCSRDGGIRTRDPLNPIQVRYRAALRPEQPPWTGQDATGIA